MLAQHQWSAAIRHCSATDTDDADRRRLLVARAITLLNDMLERPEPQRAVRVFAHTSLEPDLGHTYLDLLDRPDLPSPLQVAILERLPACGYLPRSRVIATFQRLERNSTDDAVRQRVAVWQSCLQTGWPAADQWPSQPPQLPESGRLLWSQGSGGGYIYRRTRTSLTFKPADFTEDDLPDLQQQFETGDHIVRWNVMHVLRHHRWPASLPLFQRALNDDARVVRETAVAGLSQWPDRETGWQTMYAHANAGTPNSRDADLLAALLGDTQAPVQERQALFASTLDDGADNADFVARYTALAAAHDGSLPLTPELVQMVADRCLGQTLDPSDKALRLALAIVPVAQLQAVLHAALQRSESDNAADALRVIDAAGTACAGMDGAQLADLFRAATRWPLADVRRASVSRLTAEATLHPSVLTLLEDRLNDTDHNFATDLMGRLIDHLEQPGTWDTIARAADGMQPDLAVLQVVRLLPEVDARAIPALLAFARNTHPGVRASAFWGMQFIADRTAVVDILPGLADSDPSVVLAAIATTDRLLNTRPRSADAEFLARIDAMTPRELFRRIGDRNRLHALLLGRLESRQDTRASQWLAAMHHVAAPRSIADAVAFWRDHLGIEPVQPRDD